jgi:DNA-binding LytR/AlgR family response regulator
MNCIIVDDDELSRKAVCHLVSQISYLNLVGIYENASEALPVLNNEKSSIQLMLLDIEMPDLSGIDLIKNFKKPPLTILITSKKDYAIEAFEYNVVDYLLKPIQLDRFFKAIEKAKEIFNNYKKRKITFSDEYLFVKINSTLTKINIKEILWVEALGDYISVNTAEKKYTVHSTMKSIEKKLSADRFIRVHRSYIVAIDNINSIDDNTIVIGKQLIPIGYVYKESLIKKLNLL